MVKVRWTMATLPSYDAWVGCLCGLSENAASWLGRRLGGFWKGGTNWVTGGSAVGHETWMISAGDPERDAALELMIRGDGSPKAECWDESIAMSWHSAIPLMTRSAARHQAQGSMMPHMWSQSIHSVWVVVLVIVSTLFVCEYDSSYISWWR